MIRIYDAAFSTPFGTTHQHLSTFWWIDSNGHRGVWTRTQAYEYVRIHTTGTVYVAEGIYHIPVVAHYNPTTGTGWIQTEADGVTKDNLLTLAERHRRGLPNN